MYSNVGVCIKVQRDQRDQRDIPLVAVCMYQELGMHAITMSTLSDIYFSKIISRGGFPTTNSTRVNNIDNILSQDDFANINRMV